MDKSKSRLFNIAYNTCSLGSVDVSNEVANAILDATLQDFLGKKFWSFLFKITNNFEEMERPRVSGYKNHYLVTEDNITEVVGLNPTESGNYPSVWKGPGAWSQIQNLRVGVTYSGASSPDSGQEKEFYFDTVKKTLMTDESVTDVVVIKDPSLEELPDLAWTYVMHRMIYEVSVAHTSDRLPPRTDRLREAQKVFARLLERYDPSIRSGFGSDRVLDHWIDIYISQRNSA